MKRLLAALALGTLLGAPPATAYDLITNGGFETGSLSGWQTFNQGASGGSGSWYAHTSGNGTYSGLPTSPPPAGSWQAVADNSGRAAAILYRDIVIPASTRATLQFTLWHGNAAVGGAYTNGSSLSPSSTNQRVRVDLIDLATPLLTTSSGVLSLVYQTGAGTPAVVTPTLISQDVTALAGQTVRLRVALVGTTGGLIAGIDGVTLDVSPFSLYAEFPGLDTAPARWGDFDGNGRMEVVQAGSDGVGSYWNIWRWSPLFGGTWDYFATFPGLSRGSFAIGDPDRDGDLDLGGAGQTAVGLHDLVIHRNDGGGAFTTFQQGSGFLEAGTRDGSFEWGDYDLDGDLDALVTGNASAIFYEYAGTFVGVNVGGNSLSMTNVGFPGLADGQGIWTDLYPYFGGLDAALAGSGFSSFQLGGLDGTFLALNNGLPALTSAAVAAGDFNNDGADELVLCGLEGATPVTRIYGFDGAGSQWYAWPASLPGISEPWVSVGDLDHDGLLDLALCGNTGSGRIARLYRNNGNGTFTDLNAGLTGVSDGSIELGDYEGDGDLDVLLQGNTGTTRVCRVYLNATPGSNNAPGAPSGLEWGSLDATHLIFGPSWIGGDDHTWSADLTYNFRAGTSPGAIDVIAPMSRLSDGRRLVPKPGESRTTRFRILSLTGFGHGSLYWSVQEVDQTFTGSPWSYEAIFTPGPNLAQVQDVPGDQGGKVRLLIGASLLDDAARETYPASGYNVWRLLPLGAETEAIAREGVVLSPEIATARLAGDPARRPGTSSLAPRQDGGVADVTDLPLVEWKDRLFVRSTGAPLTSAFPAGTWEIVGSFFAAQQHSYWFATSTIADSSASAPYVETFLVTVHSTTPTIWFASLPLMGYSVDNIAPAAPVGLSAAHHTGSGNQLAWAPAPEPDFGHHRVYRGITPGFVAGPGTLVATVTDPAWTDPSYDAPTVYYRVSTVDHNGNESPAVAPGQVTGTPVSAAPTAFALGAIAPNPIRGSANIGFDLPRASDVKLEVYDAAGRLVRTLARGTFEAGAHEATWSGEGADGSRASAGVYFVRLRAGTFTATKRVALAR